MPKRILQGVVTSNQNKQTITVSVERRFTHPVLKKTIRKSKKYRAHDENDQFNVGDMVNIRECAPRSKTKRWEVMTDERYQTYLSEKAEHAKQQQVEDEQRHQEHEAASH